MNLRLSYRWEVIGGGVGLFRLCLVVFCNVCRLRLGVFMVRGRLYLKIVRWVCFFFSLLIR